MGACRVCKRDGQAEDGKLCLDCFKYQSTMNAAPSLYVAKTRMVKSRRNLTARDKIMERMLSKDKQPFGERSSDTGFWIPYYDTGEDGMARLVKVEQKFSPFWNVPKAHDGLGSFLVGQIKTRPSPKKKERADKSGFYDTWDIQVATKVQLEVGGRFTDLTFNVQDMIIGQTINERFPVMPGQVTASPVGKWLALAYLRLSDRGYHDPDMFLGDTLEEVLADLHSECRPMALQIMGQGIDSTWEYSHAAWTPNLAEFLAGKGVKDDIPF